MRFGSRCGGPPPISIPESVPPTRRAGPGHRGRRSVPGTDGIGPPAMGAIQHSDLPPDVRAAREPPATDPRVADLELRPKGDLPLPRPDVGIAGSAGPRPVRSCAPW